ncbi:MAG: nicotinate-nucleotide adenylyltransferase [bacterium]|nr:nicotinate-nucleotide adenylyltransferase [Gammaproteobacteria bacterium]HIL96432.1 nicotinate-nucleotide adenylyltransferase [Pseudomonadales bacterium]
MSSVASLAIYGGTFDPVHFGHLRSAVEVYQALQVSQLKLIPASVPPHRKMPSTTREQRLHMLQLATKDLEYLQIDEREIRREGKSFTVDTLASFRDEIGPAVPLSLVLGADAYVLLNEWYAWESLAELAHLVILERPGHREQLPAREVIDWANDRWVADPLCLGGQAAGLMCRLSLTQMDISATRIREIISQGGNIDFLLPDTVLQYILKHRIYC